MGWIIYAGVVLLISVIIGMHLGRFAEAYTEMTGMMAGMTMGMLNGFLLGYAAAAAAFVAFNVGNTISLFWGNVFGIFLGLALGAYFGRAGGLMGIMDGGMGGVMGGSMGAMLAAMLIFPAELLVWTAIPLSLVYIVGMGALVVLIERSAPGHVALHRLAPYFTRAMAAEAEETAARSARRNPQIEDYYAFLDLTQDCDENSISDAYLEKLAAANEADVLRADRALAILTDPVRRQAYDAKLAVSGRGDCCPPSRVKKTSSAVPTTVAASAPSPKQGAASSAPTTVTVVASSQQVGQPKGVSVTTSNQPKQLPGKPVPANRPAQPASNQAKQQSNISAPPNRSTQPSRNGGGGGQRQPVPQRRTRPTAVPKKSGVGRGPIIGGLAVLFLLGLFASWQLGQAASPSSRRGASNGAGGGFKTDSGNTLPPEFVAQLEAKAVSAPLGPDGKQTLDFVVDGDTRGYKPNAIKVKQGVPVHFNLSVEGQDPG